MGCGESKPLVVDPLRSTGIGAVARGWDEMQKLRPSQKVSAMTGNWEISRDRVDGLLGTTLGEGPFGVVYEATVKIVASEPAVRVAVKQLDRHEDRAIKLDFFREIQYLKEVTNDSVLKILGACTSDGPILALFPLPEHGTLKQFLDKSRSGTQITFTQQLQLSLDVAHGLAYLATMEVVHRDLVPIFSSSFISFRS